jgi:glycosyltransferase involved in cell wall biosynthesis
MEDGYKIIVIAPPDEYVSKLKELQIDFYPLLKIRNKGKNPFQDLQLIKELKSFYKKINPALIFHYTIKPNIYGSFAAAQLDIPSIAITTGLGYTFTVKNFTSFIVTTMYRLALKKAKEVWFLNKDDQAAFLERNIISATKSFVLHSEGVNTNLFKPSAITTKRKTIRKFILVARLLYDKGVGEYVNASAILKQKGYQFECQVLGFLDVKNPQAISRNQIELWQQENLINYLGVTADVRPFIEAADCMVLPSYYGEGVPRTLMEAASLSKPIITTNNVGCKEVVDEGISGFLCRMKDAKDLAAQMEIVINLSEEELNVMGAAGREKMISQFDESYIISKYTDAIDKHIRL